MNYLPGWAAGGGGQGPRKEFSFTDSEVNTGSSDSYSFTNMSIGVAEPTRLIVLAVNIRNSSFAASITSISIGGITPTHIVTRANGGNSRNGYVALYIAAVPTGTTATVNITLNSATGSAAVGLYRLVNFASAAAFDFSPTSDIDNQNNMTVDVPDQGVVVAVATLIGASSSTWSGVTENVDYPDSSDSMTHACSDFLPAETGRSVSNSGGSEPSRYLCASFG